MRTFGALLAGGAASRLGGVAKPLLLIGGRTMAERALQPLRDRTERLFVSTDRPALFEPLGLLAVEDGRPERLGPLAGLAALHRAIRRETEDPFRLLVVPGDTPFLPDDLGARLLTGAAPGHVRIAASRGRWQPTIALWPGEALAGLGAWLDAEPADRSLRGWIERHPHETVEFPPAPGAPDGDPFFNVNTPDDLARARAAVDAVES
ncbi:molybdenum cofactor guanylyltransferase [Aureimonas ureilytica]|uniref:molybdenum cofactor guanylyltransferase n=1 Tax=Aureimonas ureilytica TaxID=401562 RepID=UPI0003769E88|nr:molybdenum cofactor guanylyltransferase [Aureimonas ureilytica]